MKKVLLTAAGLMLFMAFAPPLHAQNIDWDILWENDQPTNPNSTVHYAWMYGKTQYTGIAYDRTRDVLYVVNPARIYLGGSYVYMPRIWIWDASTGNLASKQGRAYQTGTGGQVPVPTDTIFTYPNSGWPYPGTTFAGNSLGQYPIYKIATDDEGRIFASNLVTPVWGICYPGPPPNCDPYLLGQGPLRIFRWDTPKSTPHRAYATLNATSTAVGGPANTNSEQTWFRWGDVLDVKGHRSIAMIQGKPTLVDSARIYVGGGGFLGEEQYFPGSKHNEINVLVADDRTPGISDGLGGRLDYRLGTKLVNRSGAKSLYWRAAHGIAGTGYTPLSYVWHDSNGDVAQVTLNNQGVGVGNLPWTIQMYYQQAISADTIAGTGFSGPMAWFNILETGKQYLVVADGQPSFSTPNRHNRARLMDVTNDRGAYKVWSDTPDWGPGNVFEQFGGRGDDGTGSGANFLETVGPYNYIVDVDYKLEGDVDSGKGYFVHIFVLMSNNGIACFRSNNKLIPVEMETFTAAVNGENVDLTWKVSSETNNSGWQVQRSFDGGKTWETISFVNGAGTTSSGKVYQYADPVTETHRSVGRAQYRLIQVDNSGSKTASHVAEVSFAVASTVELFQNYPNPFNPLTTISYQLSAQAFVTLKVYNQVGDEVATLVSQMQDAGIHNTTFDASNLPSGTYLYQINVDGKMMQKKMVVMK